MLDPGVEGKGINVNEKKAAKEGRYFIENRGISIRPRKILVRVRNVIILLDIITEVILALGKIPPIWFVVYVRVPLVFSTVSKEVYLNVLEGDILRVVHIKMFMFKGVGDFPF